MVIDFSIPRNRTSFWRYYDKLLHHLFYRSCLAIDLSNGTDTSHTCRSESTNPHTMHETIAIPTSLHLPLSFPPPARISHSDLGEFTHKYCALYTLAQEYQVCPLPSREHSMWEVIYTTFLQGPKNITRLKRGMEFCVNRVHFKHPAYPDNQGIDSGIPREAVKLEDLVRWHIGFDQQVRMSLQEPREREWNEAPGYISSFGKVFIFVDNLAEWVTAGVLLVLLNDSKEWFNEFVEESSDQIFLDTGVETYEAGTDWKAVRLPLVKAILAVMHLQGNRFWVEKQHPEDFIVECAWKDREEFGTGRRVADIW